MARNPYDKLADKLLKQSDKGTSLKKYNIDLNKVLGGGIDNKKIEQNHHQKLITSINECLTTQLNFWESKQYGDHSARISDIKRDMNLSFKIIERLNSNKHTQDDINQLKNILSKHGCS